MNKWHVRLSRTILKDRWIHVRADDCVTADGFEVAPYYVLEYPDWVHVVAINDAGGVLFVRQYRHALGDFSTELPAGMMDKSDSDPIAAAHRELLEETGCVAERARLLCVTSPNPATHANRIHTVLMQDLRYGPSDYDDPTERIETSWIAGPEAFQMATSGEMVTAIQAHSLIVAFAALGRLGYKASA